MGRAGDYNPATNFYYDGSIDQVRIYSTALSASNVTDLYNEKPEVDTSNFKTVLYTGNGAAGHYISNVGIDLETYGGLFWIKERDGTDNHHLFDTVRGGFKAIQSNNANAEGNALDLSVEANGFIIDNSAYTSLNENNKDYVSWVWKGGGDAVAGTGTGVTNVSVSANTDAGFSIVKYTGGNGISDTVNHGLADAEMIILKDLTDGTNNWRAWHKDLTSGYWLYLNLTNAQASAAADGGIRNVDANTFGFINGTAAGVEGVNSNASDYIAYVWKSVAGYSKIGSYTGATLGVTENIGFAPSMVMIKNTTQSTDPWGIFDNKRPIGTGYRSYLYPGTADDEDAYASNQSGVTLTSTGFTIDNTNTHLVNEDGQTFIYMAFK